MSVKIDTDQLLDLAKLMLPGAQDNAMVRAINRLAEEGRSESQRMMTQDYTFKGADAMVYLDKAIGGRLAAVLKASGKRLSLMYFNAQPTDAGVSANVKIGRKSNWKRAFIARPSGKNYKVRNQRATVNAKESMAFQRKGREAYPLRKLTGPAPGTILKSKKNIANLNALIGRRGETLFQEEIEKIFNGRG